MQVGNNMRSLAIIIVLLLQCTEKTAGDWDQGKKGFTFEERVAIINKHNELRAGIGAINMYALTWDPALEVFAQSYAEQCTWKHSGVKDIGDFGNVGENLYAHSTMYTIKAVEKWYNLEEPYYSYEDDTCSIDNCGHYLQVVWATTSKVGCGVSFCPELLETSATDMWYYVCTYGEAGHVPGMSPYGMVEGYACFELFCNAPYAECSPEGLCYSSTCNGKTCANGGDLLHLNCECNCTLTGYSGYLCDEVATTPTTGGGGTTAAGGGGTTSAGAGGTTSAGAGGTTSAGAGGTTSAGAGGTTSAGAGGTTSAGAGGTTSAGAGGTTSAGAGGTTSAGAGGTTGAGAGGTTSAGAGGTTSGVGVTGTTDGDGSDSLNNSFFCILLTMIPIQLWFQLI